MEPLPCPFCGAKPDVRSAINKSDAFLVACINFDNCRMTPTTKWYIPFEGKDGKTWAIEAWNQRPDASKIVCDGGGKA
jgi:hypothetical protein